MGTSNYNGLQASVRTNYWHGLISQLNYTWSHSLDEITQYVALPQDSTTTVTPTTTSGRLSRGM